MPCRVSCLGVKASDEHTGSVLVERVIRAMEGTTLDLAGGKVENEVEEGVKGKRRQRRRGEEGSRIA